MTQLSLAKTSMIKTEHQSVRIVENISAVVDIVFVHPRVHPYVVLFVCLPSLKQLKLVLDPPLT